jgi:hypothetical protein
MIEFMCRVGTRSCNSEIVLALLLSFVACSDGSNSTDVPTLPADGKFQCVAPDCCVPVDVYASKIILGRGSSDISLDIIVGVPTGSDLRWDAEVEATLPWAAPVVCTGTFSGSAQAFVGLSCPTLPLAGAPACGAVTTLILRPATSTTTDSISKQVQCAGRGSSTVKIPVSLSCPTCPSGIQAYDPCDAPGETCYHEALTSSTTWGSLPCFCQMSASGGDWRWSCAIP